MGRVTKALLVLNIYLFLLAPMCVPDKVDRGVKSADQYWAETGLSHSELETLLLPESCDSNEQSFLSCVNSISQMAERYNLVLDLDGQLRDLRKSDIESRATEKKILSQWSSKYKDLKGKIDFKSIWTELDTKWIKPTERSATIALGINGFLSVFKDPHTYLMPLAMYEEVIANSESRNSTAGFVARRLHNELIVRKVFEGSPAARAGIRKGDRIQSINGETIADMLPSKVTEVLKMRQTGRLGLRIVRGDQRKYFEIIKTETTYPSVVSRMSNKLGIITIHKFSKNVCNLAKAQLIGLKEQNVRGILLDLRDNPGGQVDEAACVVNLFIAQGNLLFETRYLDVTKPSEPYMANDPITYKGPLAVLINSGSASAAEIVAGSLRDHNRAKLIGERSFGKGSFQDGRIWGPNSKIALFETEGFYYFPSGWTPQLVGLQPDIAVNFNISDNFREEEMFLNPLVPVDAWAGPQALTWLTERDCASNTDAVTLDPDLDDPQLRKAHALLTCGENNDRHGSL